MLSFLTAFCFMCFQDSSSATRSFVGSLCIAVAILVSWCVWTSWEKRDEEVPIPTFVNDEEEAAADAPDRESLSSSKKKGIRPSLVDRFMSLPSLLKGRNDSSVEEKIAV
jgi:hypothetical protein